MAQGAFDRPGDALAGPFGRRRGPPVAPAQPGGAGQFGYQHLDLPLCLFRLLNAPAALGCLHLFPQLREAAAIGGLGLVVEPFPRVAQIAHMHTRVLAVLTIKQDRGAGVSPHLTACCAAAGQVECMEVPPRRAQQLREVRQALTILKSKYCSCVPERPVFTLSAENCLVGRQRAWQRVRRGGSHTFARLPYGSSCGARPVALCTAVRRTVCLLLPRSLILGEPPLNRLQ